MTKDAISKKTQILAYKRKVVLTFLLLGLQHIFALPCFSQQCISLFIPPDTINGIIIDSTYFGDVRFDGFGGVTCNFSLPASQLTLGASSIDTFNYTLKFSKPVNNIGFVLVGAGAFNFFDPEVFVFTTNSGIPELIDISSCFSIVNKNILISGDTNRTGGGHFTVYNKTPYTSLTISGFGVFNSAGSLFSFCRSSVIPAVDSTTQICAGDSLQIGGVFRKETGVFAYDTLVGGSSNGEDSILYTYFIVDTIQIDLGPDRPLCNGKSLTLDASVENANYLWQDGTTKPTLEVTQAGKYLVTVNRGNCSQSDSILISDANPRINLGKDTLLCQGAQITLNAETLDASYIWQDGSINSTYTVTQAGLYWVKVNVNNCIIRDSINIKYQLTPEINLGNDRLICLEDSIKLNVNPNYSNILWQNGSRRSSITVFDQGKYWVEITEVNCKVSDTVIVTKRDCEIKLELPNVFTPNGDNLNDVFIPKLIKGIDSMNTRIYNRWGKVIFESNWLSINWHGMDISTGTYLWTITFIDIFGVVRGKTGYITLLK